MNKRLLSRTTRLAFFLAVSATLDLAPLAASAEVLYGVTEITADLPDRPVTWQEITLTTFPPGGNPADFGGAHLPFPEGFQFTFFGEAYSSLDVTADGVILFDIDSNVMPTGAPKCGTAHHALCANSGGTRTIPAGLYSSANSPPNNLIAFWWGDMQFQTGDFNAILPGSAQWSVSGVAPNRIFSIRFANWGAWQTGTVLSPRTVQVDLYEGASGKIAIYYGPISEPRDPNNWKGASVGVESRPRDGGLPDGTAALACTNRLTSPASRCRNGPTTVSPHESDWPAGKALIIEPVDLPDLRLDRLAVRGLAPVTLPGDKRGLEITLDATLSNRGTKPAEMVTFDVYITNDISSAQGALPASGKVLRFAPPFTINGPSTVTRTGIKATLELPAPGRYWCTGVVDPVDDPVAKPQGAVAEAVEIDNVYIPPASDAFIVGVDLAAVSVATPSRANIDEPVPVTVRVRNAGTEAVPPSGAPPVKVAFWLSPSAALTAESLRLDNYLFLPALPGGEERELTELVRMRLGGHIPDGALDFYVIMQVDPPSAGKPSGEVAEFDETNNTAFCPITLGFPDPFVDPASFRVTSPADPSVELTELYFGDPVRLEWKSGNKGTGRATFDIGVVITTGFAIRPPAMHSNFLLQGCTPAENISGVTYEAGMAATPFSVVCTLPSTQPVGCDPEAPGPEGCTELPESPAVDWKIGLLVDGWDAVFEKDPDNNEAKKAITIRHPAMDLVAVQLEAPALAVVGQQIAVTRTFRNDGNRGNVGGAPFEYTFVLSTDEAISADDRRLEVIQGEQHVTVLHGHLAPGASDTATHVLQIPPDAAPGTYHVGLLLDPRNALRELEKNNNAVRSLQALELKPSSLRIETTLLPDAVVGVPYYQQLVAKGGDGNYVWSLDPDMGALPEELSLSAAGVLSGVPAAEGTYLFGVRVTSSALMAAASLALRVVPTPDPLAIVTTELPTARLNQDPPYSAQLVAAGGMPPYSWALAPGASMPAGFALDSTGKVFATNDPQSPATVGEKSFQVVVTDALQSSASGTVLLRVIGQALSITSPCPPSGVVGTTYSYSLAAADAVGALTWSLAKGELPAGLGLEPGEGVIHGTPARSGAFPITLRVVDEGGSEATRACLLVIDPRPARFDGITLPDAKRGQRYSQDLSTKANANAAFRLDSGFLPRGLTLESTGLISGVVSVEARLGQYDFVLEVREGEEAMSLVPLSLRVIDDGAAATAAAAGCSCSTGGMDPLLGVLLALAMPFLRRRHPGIASAHIR